MKKTMIAFLTMVIFGTFMTDYAFGQESEGTNEETEVVKPYIGGQISTSDFHNLIITMKNDGFVMTDQYAIFAWYGQVISDKGFDTSEWYSIERNLSNITSLCEITVDVNYFENHIKDFLATYGVICVMMFNQGIEYDQIYYYLFWNNPEYMSEETIMFTSLM